MSRPTSRGLQTAIRVMDGFADRTGVVSGAPPIRYLWTDAFAVCNWLGLHEETREDRFLDLAGALVEQVHRVLGRHRADDPRTGWISGLSEARGARRPTAAGLRIGKPLPEREPGDRYDPRTEWDRDGQYYHYLTKWMLALWRSWRVTGNADHHRQAVELARVVHTGFTTGSGEERRLVWKMSIGLSRPLVPSSGHHDPLDGLVTTSLLAADAPEEGAGDLLAAEIRELDAMCRGRSWVTDDPLGVGGLLVDGLRCRQLADRGHATGLRHVSSVIQAGRSSLDALGDPRFMEDPADRRLAFRELGLVIGLRAAARLEEETGLPKTTGERILAFWSIQDSRRAPTWSAHRDISEVMWATALHPRGFLDF